MSTRGLRLLLRRPTSPLAQHMLAGALPTGESVNAEFLKDFMLERLKELGGEEKCCGFVTDGEAACVKAAAELEEEYPKLVR